MPGSRGTCPAGLLRGGLQLGRAVPLSHLLSQASLLELLLPVGLCLVLHRAELSHSEQRTAEAGVIYWRCLPGVGSGFSLG